VVHRLAVDPKFRGKGVAVDLLMQAEHEAIKRGIAALRIDTNSQNNAARALFPKLGYMYAGEIGLDFRPGLRFCCFEKRLDGKA
jgi:ribosomal protein S18 acetylase RimI-like enzyme